MMLGLGVCGACSFRVSVFVGLSLCDKVRLPVGPLSHEASLLLRTKVPKAASCQPWRWRNASKAFDVPMSLDFRIFDTTVMILSVFITHTALQDGCSNWLEGSILIAIYVLIAIICWYIPD